MVKFTAFLNSFLIFVAVSTAFPVSTENKSEENVFGNKHSENEQYQEEDSDQSAVTAGYENRLSDEFQANQHSDIKNSIDEGNKHFEELFKGVNAITEDYNNDNVDDVNNENDENDDSIIKTEDNVDGHNDSEGYVYEKSQNKIDENAKHVDHLLGKEDLSDDENENEGDNYDNVDDNNDVDNNDNESYDNRNTTEDNYFDYDDNDDDDSDEDVIYEDFQNEINEFIKNIPHLFGKEYLSDDDSGQDSENKDDDKYSYMDFDKHYDDNSEKGDISGDNGDEDVDDDSDENGYGNNDSNSNDQQLLLLKEINQILDKVLSFFESDTQNNEEFIKTKHNRPITITISRNHK